GPGGPAAQGTPLVPWTVPRAHPRPESGYRSPAARRAESATRTALRLRHPPARRTQRRGRASGPRNENGMRRVRSAPARIMVMIVVAGAFAAPAAGQQQRGQPPARAAAPRDSAAIAREIERRLGPGITQQEIVERLRRSGLSRSQV